MTKGTGAKKVNAKKVAKAVEDKTFGAFLSDFRFFGVLDGQISKSMIEISL